MNYRQSFITATILLLFALVGTALVAFTYDSTRERIAANERATLQRKLNLLIPPQAYDNTLLEDTLRSVMPRCSARNNRSPCTVHATATRQSDW